MVTKYYSHGGIRGMFENEHGKWVDRAEYDALALENAAMRNALDSIRIYSSDTLSGPSDFVPDMAAWLRDGVEHLHQVSIIETTATDAALAAIQAQGVEKALAVVSACRENICPGGLSENRQYEESIVQPHLDGIADELENLIIELREAK